ncbi:DMT family transporter [Glaciihabitans sp. INWT7]|uniref:DMT family transporter n=1 Tax=Glaciihabitans sp. INWT7 TaxID=2596912 RepID=UPI001625E965|nr:DMT family transporter [Glaciihabitans sp. INWT7]QNE48078.1 DMT family transporter [Glaciihabitans sp. INWT7]
MLSVVLALAGSVIYGASDFFGGLAARGTSAVRVTLINSISGLAILIVAALVLPSRWGSSVLLWGGLAGACGAVALVLLYACLAIGPMSILSPILALVAAVIPIAVGFARGERLSGLGYLGLAVGLVAIILICLVPGERAVRPSPRGIVMAVGAGIAIGGYLVFIDLTPPDSGPAPLLVTFVVTGVVMSVALLGQRLARRGAPRPPITRATVIFSVLCGLTDAAAAFLFLLALRAGELSIVSVLNALAPAGTIVLAALVLRERIAPVQWVGLAVALVAAALLALA